MINRAKLEAAIQRMLYPVISVLIDFGVTEAHFAAMSREVFVKAAAKKIQLETGQSRPNASRVSMMTGIRRKAVKPILDGGSLPEPNDKWYRNRCAKVLADWHHESEFLSQKGAPLSLPLAGRDVPSIESLVRLSGTDLSHVSILEELIAVGAVEKRKTSDLYYAKRKVFRRRGTDIKALEAIADELFDLSSTRAVLLKKTDDQDESVMADSFVTFEADPESLHVLLRQLRDASSTMISRSQQAIARHSLDKQDTSSESKGVRVGVGVYVFKGDEMEESEYYNQSLELDKKQSGER